MQMRIFDLSKISCGSGLQSLYLEGPVALWAPLDTICEPLLLSCSCSFLFLSYVSKLLPELGDFLMQTPVEALQLSEAVHRAMLSNLHSKIQVNGPMSHDTK